MEQTPHGFPATSLGLQAEAWQAAAEETVECCICGFEVEVPAHNPEPVPIRPDSSGRCCGWCNANIVIPLRLRMAGHQTKEVPSAEG